MQRPRCSLWLLLLAVLVLAGLVSSKDPREDGHLAPVSEPMEEAADSAEPIDGEMAVACATCADALVCAPLREAERLLARLQPQPYAHLERKISSSAVSLGRSGWGENLGWSQEVGPCDTQGYS